MGTNEDYLDRLLRAAMNTESAADNAKEEPGAMSEENVSDEAVLQETAVSVDDDIEEENVLDEAILQEAAVSADDDIAEENILGEAVLQEAAVSADDGIAEENILGEAVLQEAAVSADDDIAEENVLGEAVLQEAAVSADDDIAEENVLGEAVLQEAAISPDDDMPEDNPNRQMTPEEIAAMFAMAEENDAETVNADKSADDGIGKENISDEAILQEAAISADDDMPEDNPNRQMTPEEIAAMFAMAEENDAETVNADKFEEEEPGKQENASMNEVEVDLADMSELEELLGIKDISAQNEENSIKSEAAEVENKISLEEKNERSLEETKNPASDLENEELTDILDMLGTDDGDLAEINELLKKSDQHELVDDEMLAMLESVSDEEQKEKNVSEEDSAKETEDSEKSNVEKSKKKRWGKRKRSEPQEAGKAEPDADSEQKEEERRPGFWGNLFKALLDEEEEEEADTSAEDAEKKESAIKGKKDKGKKKKKAPETNEEILEELAEEDVAVKKGKKKKEKKPGKEKTTKKAKAVDLKKFEPEEPLKKMPRKMIVRIFILCFSIMAVVILVAMFVPQLLQKAEARKAFYKGKYEEAYQGLVGKELSESDEILLQKIEVVLLLEKKVQAYEAYMLAGQNAEALNALLEGVAFYQEKSDLIDSLGIRSEASGKYNNILMLLDKYGLEEEETIEMTGLDAISYTKRVREIVGAGQAENGADSENKSVDNHAASGNENAAQNENQPPEEPLDDPLQEELD